MSEAHEICKKWQSLYCAGSPMPRYFRQRASEYFSLLFHSEKDSL